LVPPPPRFGLQPPDPPELHEGAGLSGVSNRGERIVSGLIVGAGVIVQELPHELLFQELLFQELLFQELLFQELLFQELEGG